MKLYINRDQDKGLLGGMSFILRGRVELSPQEADLIKKYKAHKEILMQGEGRFGINLSYTIENLINGVTQKCKDVSEVLKTEQVLKEVCGTFKTYLEVMASFGGEEVVEY